MYPETIGKLESQGKGGSQQTGRELWSAAKILTGRKAVPGSKEGRRGCCDAGTREDFEDAGWQGENLRLLVKLRTKLLGMDNPEGAYPAGQLRYRPVRWRDSGTGFRRSEPDLSLWIRIQRCEVDLYTGGRESRKSMSDIYSRRRLLQEAIH